MGGGGRGGELAIYVSLGASTWPTFIRGVETGVRWRLRWEEGDFGDFGVSFVATVAGRYTRRGGPRLSVQGEPLIVLTRGP